VLPIRVLKVELAITQSDPERLRPGMRFRGSVETARRKGVLIVPVEAISESANGPVVRRRGAAGIEEIPVTLGVRAAREVEIAGGLSEGDRVLLGGAP
jgi:hypothetical protein